MDSIHLIGAEDVRRAANTMTSAANEMAAAVRNMEGALERHQRFLDDWLMRYQTPIEPAPVSAPSEPVLWNDWAGGFCPVDERQQVWVKLRDGTALLDEAGAFVWRRYRSPPNTPPRPNEVVQWRLP
jgi:hypothetical protein